LSLESYSSVLEQTPKVWRSSCESDESESHSTCGSEGSGWQEVADGSHIQAQITFQYNEMHGPKHAPSQDAPHPPPVLYFCMFFTVHLLNELVK
jgi:hypothetical protein